MILKKNTSGTSRSNHIKIDPLIHELLEASSIASLLLAPDRSVVYANPESKELFGIHDNVVGSDFKELFNTERAAEIEQLFKNAKEGGSVQSRQLLRIGHKENDIIWGIIKFTSLQHFNDGRYLLCQIKNISEQKEYEEKIAGQSHLLFELINAIPNNIFVKNTKGEFLLANAFVSNLMGLSDPQELLGKTDFDFHPKKLAKKYYDDEQEVIRTGKAKINIIEQVVESNHTRRWYSTSKFPLKDNEGNTIGIMGIGRDITSWVKEQKALRKAKIKAEKADQLKSAFLANVSHEIRTPLNGILGFSQFLKNALPKDDNNQKYIDFILTNGKQLLQQISDIIDISKIDSGQLPVYKRNFVLNDLMSELKFAFKEKIKHPDRANIGLSLELGLDNEASMIYSDDLKIKQVLSNFLNNAIKFTRHGEIRFGYELKDKTIRFFVKDTGIGISPEHSKVIFERFHQIDFSLSRKHEGSGLGLAIAEGIVKLLDGKIGVNSELNKGSEFYFTIPYETSDTATKKTDTETENFLKNKRIVAVDDRKQSYEVLEIMLFQNEIEVWHAKDQDSFYEFISSRSNKIDLIIINLQTKWLKGCSSIQKIKSVASRVPILII
ncbi:MAG: ATP-binding protein, partial [Bacteroidales bacterium]